MNIDTKVTTALSALGLPIARDEYVKDDKRAIPVNEYITFNYVIEDPILFADGADQAEETIFRVNYFTKDDPQATKKLIRKLLRTAGFTIVDTTELFETDTKYHHIIVECSIDGLVDD